jgi:hypothetical protein
VATLRVVASPGGAVDGRRPPGVPATDLDADPVRRAPDSGSPWPVYLGKSRRTCGPPLADLRGRPYAGAVGDRVTHPLGTDAVTVGTDTESFAVRSGPAQPVTVDAAGDLRIQADTSVTRAADVALGPATAAANALLFDPPAATPAEAAPWHVYRSRTADRRSDELRLEIAPPPAPTEAARSALAIGTGDYGRFRSCLTVNPDCSVRVAGDLHVTGRIIEGPVQLDPNDPRFAGALLAQWLGGIASAGTTLAALYGAGIVVEENALSGLAGSPGTISYKIGVGNPTDFPLTSVRLGLTVASEGDTVISDQQVGTRGSLAPGETAEFDSGRSVPGVDYGDVDVTFVATGVGPAGNTVSDTLQKTVTLEVIIG